MASADLAAPVSASASRKTQRSTSYLCLDTLGRKMKTVLDLEGSGENDGETASLIAREDNRIGNIVRIVLLGTLMILFSALQIHFNKYLLNDGVFPFATHLGLYHMTFGALFSLLLLTIAPSIYPTVTDATKRIAVDNRLLLYGMVPIAVFNAASLAFGNSAYAYASVAFLQMVKQSSVVIVYVISLVMGLDTLQCRTVSVLALIFFSTLITVHGELNFVFLGLVLQTSCTFCDSLRLVLQSSLLSGLGLQIDALTFNLFLMPLSAAVLASVIMLNQIGLPIGGTGILSPSVSEIATNWKLLSLNILLAFAVNVLNALFIKYSSALAMVLASLVKNIVIVIFSASVMHEVVSARQWFGFALQLWGIAAFALLRTLDARASEGAALKTGWSQAKR